MDIIHGVSGTVGAFSIQYHHDHFDYENDGSRRQDDKKYKKKQKHRQMQKQKEGLIDGDTSMGSTSRRSAGVQSVESLFHNEISIASQGKEDERRRQRCIVYGFLVAVVLMLSVVAVAIVVFVKREEANPVFGQADGPRNDSVNQIQPSSAPSNAPLAAPTPQPILRRGDFTMGEFLSSSPEFSVAFKFSEPIMDILTDTSQTYTLFMARDLDFHEWPGADLVQKWRHPAWEPQYVDMMKNLLVPTELRSLQEATVTTLSAHNLTLTPDSANGIEIVQANKYWASNGVIHLTKGFLFPPWIEKTLHSELEERFPAFFSLLNETGVLHMNDNAFHRGDNPMTVLIPTDEALGKLPNDDPDALRRILSYHVLPEINYVYQDNIGISTKPSLLDRKGVKIDAYQGLIDDSIPLSEEYFIVNNGILQPLLGNETLDPDAIPVV